MDFSSYKFRCSQLGKLMTEPRSKSELLSQTTMDYLDEIYIREVHGREKDIDSKYMEKGTLVEEDSLTLVSEVLGQLLIKNKEHFENQFICGTPDVVTPKIRDIKSAWDIWTFRKVKEVSKDYFWQLQGYMFLRDEEEAFLDYCLVDTPEGIIYQEVRSKTYYKGIMDTDPLYPEIEQEIEKNMKYPDIEKSQRVKTFHVPRVTDFEKIQLYKRIEDCRIYLNSIEKL